MFYTHNVFDSSDPSTPLKTLLSTKYFFQESRVRDFFLELHHLELQEEIYSPFKTTQNVPYLTLNSQGDERNQEVLQRTDT